LLRKIVYINAELLRNSALFFLVHMPDAERALRALLVGQMAVSRPFGLLGPRNGLFKAIPWPDVYFGLKRPK